MEHHFPADRPFRVAVLGTGRVASHLVPALARAGHQVTAVWGRSLAAATELAALAPGALPVAGPGPLPAADIYLVAVSDAAVAEVVSAVRFPAGSIVAHTSGSVPLAAVAAVPEVRGGVWYPLQTFSAGRAVDWAQVPICVEAADSAAETALLALARSLSPEKAQLVATPQRQALHVAAVFACNFPYHLLGISQELLGAAGLPWPLLEPLIRETVEKALTNPPFQGQTGPAVRADVPTMQAHQRLLADHPNWQALYEQLSASIRRQHEERTT
ncbi:DUF2520 domain-containing protein [Hymenobacter sp. J193]|uniref:Rossmann-like and DUF2520 domain-containing protein n=1 Tax=Hymenobacter sp. J193 TaxID=2898429 RepID=UPI002151ABC0|nr:Rossmann-like and DUF2520 domain-containing protein [Hymenobacter sp. J193]MCR5887408.1 DUF2520 domain-containing protein [Hymenobacter sp. J193]